MLGELRARNKKGLLTFAAARHQTGIGAAEYVPKRNSFPGALGLYIDAAIGKCQVVRLVSEKG
jgi:hypothetical protein